MLPIRAADWCLLQRRRSISPASTPCPLTCNPTLFENPSEGVNKKRPALKALACNTWEYQGKKSWLMGMRTTILKWLKGVLSCYGNAPAPIKAFRLMSLLLLMKKTVPIVMFYKHRTRKGNKEIPNIIRTFFNLCQSQHSLWWLQQILVHLAEFAKNVLLPEMETSWTSKCHYPKWFAIGAASKIDPSLTRKIGFISHKWIQLSWEYQPTSHEKLWWWHYCSVILVIHLIQPTLLTP